MLNLITFISSRANEINIICEIKLNLNHNIINQNLYAKIEFNFDSILIKNII